VPAGQFFLASCWTRGRSLARREDVGGWKHETVTVESREDSGILSLCQPKIVRTTPVVADDPILRAERRVEVLRGAGARLNDGGPRVRSHRRGTEDFSYFVIKWMSSYYMYSTKR
jgi:hypothetical protein